MSEPPIGRPATDGLNDDVLAAAIAGDQAAFAAVYRDIQPRLRRYAWTLVGQDAEDVTGEAWLQIARDICGFTGDVDGFRGWTARIVRNRAMDLVRMRARRPADPTDRTDVFEQAAPDTATVALDALSTVQALELIACLPREQAEAVILRAIVGLDSKTAGEVLGKSSAAVRVAAHRGLKSLAKRLNSEGTGDLLSTRDGQP
jgi:RNA polymerase sigma-70 factor (ECF subfamily)